MLDLARRTSFPTMNVAKCDEDAVLYGSLASSNIGSTGQQVAQIDLLNDKPARIFGPILSQTTSELTPSSRDPCHHCRVSVMRCGLYCVNLHDADDGPRHCSIVVVPEHVPLASISEECRTPRCRVTDNDAEPSLDILLDAFSWTPSGGRNRTASVRQGMTEG